MSFFCLDHGKKKGSLFKNIHGVVSRGASYFGLVVELLFAYVLRNSSCPQNVGQELTLFFKDDFWGLLSFVIKACGFSTVCFLLSLKPPTNITHLETQHQSRQVRGDQITFCPVL